MSFIYPFINKPIDRYKPIFESYNVNIDLETHGVDYTKPTVVTSIGAACFVHGELRSLSVNIDVAESRSMKFNEEERTLSWISSLSNDVQDSMYSGAVSVTEALTKLNEFIEDIALIAHKERKGFCMYGNSPKFDMQMLTHYYNATGIKNPFNDFLEGDYRSMMRSGMLPKDEYSMIKSALVDQMGSMQHCAVFDAILQATTLEALSAKMRIARLGS